MDTAVAAIIGALTDAVMATLTSALINPTTRDELVPVVFKVVAAHDTINRAIDAHGTERSDGNG